MKRLIIFKLTSGAGAAQLQAPGVLHVHVEGTQQLTMELVWLLAAGAVVAPLELSAQLDDIVVIPPSGNETLPSLAMSGLLDGTSCNAIFVGAAWSGDDSGLAGTPLGQHFGSRLTLHNFEADIDQCATQDAEIARRPAELRVSSEVCHGVALSDFVCNAAVAAAGSEPRCAEGHVPFYVQRAAVCSSLRRPNTATMRRHSLDTDRFGCGDTVRVLAMETSTIDASGFAPSSLDFVKLDVQGAALAVLRGGRAALASVSFAQIEVEFIQLYEDQPLFAEVDAFMREELGLTFVGFSDGAMTLRNEARSALVTPRSRRVLVHVDALYIREPLPITPRSGGRVADPATHPYDDGLRARIVKVAALASAHDFLTIVEELLDWMLRWSAAPLCVRLRAAIAIFLIPAGYQDIVDSGTLGASYADAAALLAEATAEGTVHSAHALCHRRGDPNEVVASRLVDMLFTGTEHSASVVVELRRGVEPRSRAAEFCTRHSVSQWDSCVDALGKGLADLLGREQPEELW